MRSLRKQYAHVNTPIHPNIHTRLILDQPDLFTLFNIHISFRYNVEYSRCRIIRNASGLR